jgi:hypothetical protein
LLAIINDKDDNKDEYHYDNGIYYFKKPQMVLKQSPLVLKCLLYLKRPVEVNETNNYYYGGAL